MSKIYIVWKKIKDFLDGVWFFWTIKTNVHVFPSIEPDAFWLTFKCTTMGSCSMHINNWN